MSIAAQLMSSNDTSRYLDDIFNIDNPYFDNMISSIYPKELKLTKANISDISAAFLDLDISINNGKVSTKIYDKRDDFDFNIVNYPHLDGDVPRATSYGVYISQLIRYARACSSIDDFNNRNRIISEKLLKQGYRYNKLKEYCKQYISHLPDEKSTNSNISVKNMTLTLGVGSWVLHMTYHLVLENNCVL